MGLSADAVEELRLTLEKLTNGEEPGIPGLTFVVVDKDGSIMFEESAGKRGLTSQEDMSPENVFWIASCTKMLTGLCCMQLVEKGILKLDDAIQTESILPELREVRVLRKGGILEEKKRGITLRMLLNHTSGFSYTFFNETLRDWALPAGLDEFSGDFKDIALQPLLSQPGERWEYGVGIDWAGVAIERVTGLKLNEYIQKHICAPLGLHSINMFPTSAMKDKLAYMHERYSDGRLAVRDHLHRRALMAETAEERDAIFNSGGAGMFARPSEYCRTGFIPLFLLVHILVTTDLNFSLGVLSVLLNNGTCPKTGVKLLEPSTVDEMFQNQVPQFPNLGRQGIPAAKADLTNPIPDIYPLREPEPQGWGLTWMITSSPTGRPAGAAWWAGLANLYWWCDRENGVAGMICSQILPFADAKVLGAWVELESIVYRSMGVIHM